MTAEEKSPADIYADAKKPAPKQTVLVVDDTAPLRNIVRYNLETAGYKVLEADTGSAALAVLARETAHLILMDMSMPSMDGITLCDKIKKNPNTANIPVIFCTARGSKEDVIASIHAGALDYIVKPFTKDILLSKIAKALSVKDAPQETPPQESHEKPAEPEKAAQ